MNYKQNRLGLFQVLSRLAARTRSSGLALILVCVGFTNALAANSALTLAFDDTFTHGLLPAYRTQGAVNTDNGLRLKDKTTVSRDVDGRGMIALDFTLNSVARTSGDPKFQAQVHFGDTTANVQIVEAPQGNRLLIFGYRDGLPPENYREFPFDGPLTGKWHIELVYGLLRVSKGGNIVGLDGFSTVDSVFTNVMLASIHGEFEVGRLAVSRLLDPQRDEADQRSLAEADFLAGQAQQSALFGKEQAAVSMMQRVVQIYETILGPQAIRTAWAKGGLGTYLTRTGVVGAARANLEASLNSFKEAVGPDHLLTATSQLAMANLLIGIGDVDQGMPLAERALTTALLVFGDRSPVVAAALSSYAGGSLRSGRPREAAEALAAALSIREAAFGKDDLHLTPYMIQLGDLYAQLGDFDGAKSMLSDASNILKTNPQADPDQILRVERSLISIDLKRGDPAGAGQAFDDLATRATKQFGDDHPNVALILHDAAVAHLASGDLLTAETDARKALSITELRASAIAEQLAEAEALSFLGSVYPIRDELLSIELENSPSLTVEQYAELAQARSIYTRTAMVAAGALIIKGPRDEQLRKDLKELADIRSFLSGFSSYHGPMAQDQRLSAVLDVVTKEKERLQRDIADRQLQTNKAQSSISNLNASLASLSHNDAMIDIVVANIWFRSAKTPDGLQRSARYLAFVLTRNAVDGISIDTIDLGPRAEIDEHISAWLALLSDRSGDVIKEQSEADWVGKHVWEQLRIHLRDAHNILVVPDGEFNVLPWAALRASSADRFLIEDGYRFVSELSSDYVAEIGRRGDAQLGQGTLIVGDLDFGNGSPSETREIFVGTSSEGIWSSLRGAHAEVEALLALSGAAGPTRLLVHAEATEVAVEEAMPQARYVHFATHGYFAQGGTAKPIYDDVGTQFLESLASRSQRSPLLRNGLVLSEANLDPTFEQGTIRVKDGLLSAEEIAGLDLSSVELVVMSACETARGVDVAGEGSFGLQRTFLMAGARAVIAGLWRVDDQATKDLMVKFYELLWSQHLPKAEALRRAQVYMIEKSRLEAGQGSARSIAERGPYYWAAFAVAGDWK